MTETNPEGARLGGKVQGWQHWTTPKIVLRAVEEVGPIGLDPCSNEFSHVQSKSRFWENGLEVDWKQFCDGQLVYVNPPYNKVKEFAKKCILESVAGCEIIALLASRTDTQWSKGCLMTGDALCFWEGRIKFENPPPGSQGDAPSIPSVVYYWGNRRWEFCQAFKKHGFCIDLRQVRARQSAYAAGSVSP